MILKAREAEGTIVFRLIPDSLNTKGYSLWEAQEADFSIHVQQMDVLNWKVTTMDMFGMNNRTFIRHCLLDMYDTVTNLTGKTSLFNASMVMPADYNPMASL